MVGVKYLAECFSKKGSEISSWAQLLSNFDAQKPNFVLNCMELCLQKACFQVLQTQPDHIQPNLTRP